MTCSTPWLTPSTVPSPHLYRRPKRLPARRAASLAVHTVVYLLHSCTARAPLRLPTHHPVHASRLPMPRMVRCRRHTTHSQLKHLPLLCLRLPPLPRLSPHRVPARPSHAPPQSPSPALLRSPLRYSACRARSQAVFACWPLSSEEQHPPSPCCFAVPCDHCSACEHAQNAHLE
jgi:hypothetical protein